MMITNEISSITVLVTHYNTEHEMTQEIVPFKVYREGEWFKAIPLVSEKERKANGLPEEISFVYVNHSVVAANDMEAEALDVIKKIILELQMQQLV